jgi:hypothetical protein
MKKSLGDYLFGCLLVHGDGSDRLLCEECMEELLEDVWIHAEMKGKFFDPQTS